MAVERRTITFSGRVQGVGFRMTALHLADNLPLAGTVRNTPDGTVEVVAQGESADIDALIARLREHFGSFIRNVTWSTSPPASALRAGMHIVG
jgi:acylphosphatase